MPKPKHEFVATPRQAMGWPCFHCGKPLRHCQGPNRTRKNRRCCGNCKGKASH